jgi:hypothetical protein
MGVALTGTLSSTTAQGYLPQYHGSAAVSLGPPATVNSLQAPMPIQADAETDIRPGSTNSQRTENRPPPRMSPLTKNPASATDLLRRLARLQQDQNQQEDEWGTKPDGIGPIFGDSDW